MDDLVAVTIVSTDGDYVIPFVPRDTMENVYVKNGELISGLNSICITNLHGSVVSVPAKFVVAIHWDGEEKWRGPAVLELRTGG